MNLGIDFGSTYSMLSYYDKINKILKGVVTQGNGPHIPSIACYKSPGKLVSGQAARKLLENRADLTPYRAFKMLLPVSDPDELEQMGYRGENTPKKITQEFLKQQLQTAKTKLHVDCFDRVTICVPHVWDTDVSTVSGKAVLLDVCEKLRAEGLMNEVRVVSEPAAATACFAHNYALNARELYQGWILIVDYGGGTLDITLSQVNTIDRDGGAKAMEITVQAKGGAGENHPDNRVGDAGIAYMQGVIEQALADAGIHNPPRDHAFLSAADVLESSLINTPEDLIDKVRFEYDDNPEGLRDDMEVFESFSYNGQLINITYSTLARVYDTVIRPVLKKELDKIFLKMKVLLGISEPKELPKDPFKIALVGGFGQYILVQQQVRRYFNIGDDDGDPRLYGLDMRTAEGAVDTDRENAISYGAALISSDEIYLRKTAPYSIGLVSQDPQTLKNTFEFAFQSNDLLKPGKIYYLKQSIYFHGRTEHNSTPENFPWKFAIKLDGDPDIGNSPDRARKLIPLEPIRIKMLSIKRGCYDLGFSINESEVISFFSVPTDTYGKRLESEAEILPLGNFSQIFGDVIQIRKAPIIP